MTIVRHACLCGKYRQGLDKGGKYCFTCKEEIVYVISRGL